jgi:tetratricopeptide (TPR) repeat protein
MIDYECPDRKGRTTLALPLALLVLVVLLRAQGSDVTQVELAIQQAIQTGDLATASRLVNNALEQHPSNGGLLNLRGVVHARRDEVPEARKDFSDAVRLAPGLMPAWQNLARACQLQAGQDASAVSCAISSWEHVSRLEPGDAEAHSSLALLYERQGKFSESLHELTALSAQEASSTGNLALRCADLSALGRMREATAAASRLAASPDFSEADFDSMQSVLQSPKAAGVVVTLIEALDARGAASLASLRRLAIAYEQSDRLRDARKTLERVAMLDPKNTAHLLELARLADATKDHEAALGYLAHARDLAPDNPQIHYLFAMIAAEMNLPVEAKRSLDRALALDPENPNYNYAMGTVILTTRDAATAAGYFQKFVKARPADPTGHYALGIAYFASGDYDKSKEEMQLAENSPKAAGAEYYFGRIARIEGHADDAARHLRKSIELMPSFAPSHTELARVLMLQDNFKEAQTELDRAVHLDPTNFQANEQLLVVYKRTHDPRAVKQAELVKHLDEDRSKRAELMLRTVEVRR